MEGSNRSIKISRSYLQRLLGVIDHSWRYISGLPALRRSRIAENLYLGGQYNHRGLNRLKKLGINAIVNMRMTSPQFTEIKDFAYMHLQTEDQHAPTLEQLDQGVKFIKKYIAEGGKVYIHCREGEGRGPSMAAAYLISTGFNLTSAIEKIRSVRPFIRPTIEQLEQLAKFVDLTQPQT